MSIKWELSGKFGWIGQDDGGPIYEIIELIDGGKCELRFALCGPIGTFATAREAMKAAETQPENAEN